ncbi:MAG: hypothetical protein BWY11_02231 [Firmicutes bacterium ADurb.Bin182]|nr:MAG: hypothetical protein BWY11_02231 [Firmicutes bacterium ADurb.Bin182]
MRKLICTLVIFVMVLACATGCKKLVSETCAVCGESATKNYTSPQNIDVTYSVNESAPYLVKANSTIAVCDECNGYLSLAVGESK